MVVGGGYVVTGDGNVVAGGGIVVAGGGNVVSFVAMLWLVVAMWLQYGQCDVGDVTMLK